ncbi:hypothetical protein BpHYR1_006674 [Brachionus plicatilis]|uniref:Uncharacterized protein n=1 Tax=Brachionus plicatilis TaxID=10195 RepID=A0A3M7QP54_BRAPC|nr:hypothetical protein BpHYR1_006674 [Brachionus plicatilis]
MSASLKATSNLSKQSFTSSSTTIRVGATVGQVQTKLNFLNRKPNNRLSLLNETYAEICDKPQVKEKTNEYLGEKEKFNQDSGEVVRPISNEYIDFLMSIKISQPKEEDLVDKKFPSTLDGKAKRSFHGY